MELIIASHNQDKLNEFKKIIGNKIKLYSLYELGFNDEIPEREKTVEKNAVFKAQYINKETGKNVFADDTGLEIDSLNGEPGVYSARYAGIEKNSEKNIDLVLNKLKNKKNRKARFKTVISLIHNNKTINFEGIVERQITNKREEKMVLDMIQFFNPMVMY